MFVNCRFGSTLSLSLVLLRPLYIVRLESDIQLPHGTLIPLIRDEFVEYIDEEELFKRFHDPGRSTEFDIFEEQEEEVNDCESTTTKRRRMSNEQEIINSNHYDSYVPQFQQHHHYGSSQFSEPNLTGQNFNQLQPHHMDVVPNQASMMYNQQQQLMRPEIYQPNQMGFVPTLPTSQAPVMMYNQQHGFRSSQITEPNLGAQVSTMFAGQDNLRHPFGMRQQPFLNATAPVVYNPPQHFMRPDINQPNQMGIVPNPLPVQAPMMYNQQYIGQITEPNLGAQVSTMFLGPNNPNQPFAMRQQPFQSAAAPVMYNQQSMGYVTNQQNQMRSMRMFNVGQSSYRGRGDRRSRARGLGRRGRD
ncbi:hypothetical protein YC2023_112987 [Brassica napus]